MFNSDVLARLAVAVDLVNAYRHGQLNGAATHGPDYVFDAHGYLPPTSHSDWIAIATIAKPIGGLLDLVVACRHDDVVERLNRELRKRRVVPHIDGDGDIWTLHFHPPTAGFAEGWAAGIAAALALAYASSDWSRIGICSSPQCRDLFLDRGRNQQRRFCSLQCQNRSKSADYRHRRSST